MKDKYYLDCAEHLNDIQSILGCSDSDMRLLIKILDLDISKYISKK